MSKIKNILISLKEKILKNEFNKNVLILSGGTIIAQALPVLISPILTRLYSPSDFGVLALFISITSIVGVIANGRYELAIMLPEKDEDAINVAAVGFLFNIAISLLFLIFIIIFKKPFLKLLKAESLSFWIYFAPLTVFFIGLFQILNYANNRFKLYKDISKSNILKSIASSLVQLTLGFLKTGTSGLILGQMSAQAVANTKLFSNIKKTGLLKEIKKEKIKKMAAQYSNFPKFSMWAGLLNVTGYQIVNLLIGMSYGQKELGYYYMAFRILGIPSSFIGTAISQVFFKQATEEKNKTGNIINTFNSTLKKLIILSVPIFGIIFLIIRPVFGIVFGKIWDKAGLYAMILTPMFAINFIVKTFTLVPFIYKKNIVDFAFQSGIFVMSVLPFCFGIKDFNVLLVLYSLILSIYYFIYYIILRSVIMRRT